MNKTRYLVYSFHPGDGTLNTQVIDDEFFCEKEAELRAEELYSKRQFDYLCVVEVVTHRSINRRIAKAPSSGTVWHG